MQHLDQFLKVLKEVDEEDLSEVASEVGVHKEEVHKEEDHNLEVRREEALNEVEEVLEEVEAEEVAEVEEEAEVEDIIEVNKMMIQMII